MIKALLHSFIETTTGVREFCLSLIDFKNFFKFSKEAGKKYNISCQKRKKKWQKK